MPPLRHLIGVDIGGTKIAIAAVHSSGHILARTALPTEAERGFERAIQRLIAAIEDVDSQASLAPSFPEFKDSSRPGVRPVRAGIGIGCAGPVDPALGLINNPFTLTGWDRCDIVQPLAKHFAVPVRLENDADAAVLGECWVGAGRNTYPVVMLTFGTGVGGGAMFQSGIHRGAGGAHPELGHVPVDPRGPECYCGIAGCLESIASGTAIGDAGKAFGLRDSREVFAAANAGSPDAAAVVRRAVEAASTAAWTLCHTLLPRRLILGGGLMNSEFENFAGPMRERIARATQFNPLDVEIVPALLGNDAGIVGAASLIHRPEQEARLKSARTA